MIRQIARQISELKFLLSFDFIDYFLYTNVGFLTCHLKLLLRYLAFEGDPVIAFVFS